MKDFTMTLYKQLLHSLIELEHSFKTLEAYIQSPLEKIVIIRHDVDLIPQNALEMAKIENELGIRASYYFRIVSDVFDKEIIKKIAEMGHEIGYHYEVLSKTKGNLSKGIELFKNELNEFRKIVDIKTISMHGSPLSKWDSRKLWEKYNYRDFGIIGEPYFDIDFNEVLYLTDTGRRWDGESYNVRDRVRGERQGARGEGIGDRSKKIEDRRKNIEDRKILYNTNTITNAEARGEGQEERKEKIEERIQNKEEKKIQTNNITKFKNSFHSTNDIIRAVREGRLPEKIMLNIHPQRWNDRFIPWMWELVSQNVKNVVKKWFFVKKNS